MLGRVEHNKPSILHVCGRDRILDLRSRVLSLEGYDVVGTPSIDQAYTIYDKRNFSLLLIDVEGNGQMKDAEELCHDVKKKRPTQKVAFVCNYRVSLESDCPDEIIHSDFNPAELVRGVSEVIQ
jgi:DNA-binding NtrC family response regulator